MSESNLPKVEIDLELLRAGDPGELTKVVRAYGPVLKSCFGSIAADRHHLGDIVQDFWVHILPKLDRYSEKTPFGPWLVRSATNFRNSRARKDTTLAARTANLAEGRELVDDGSSLDDEAQRRLLEQAVFRAISKLPAREGEAVTLTLLEGWSNVEAAKIMELRPAAVANLVRRGLFKMQDDDLLRSFHEDL